jgi:hypothetical protein
MRCPGCDAVDTITVTRAFSAAVSARELAAASCSACPWRALGHLVSPVIDDDGRTLSAGQFSVRFVPL